MHAVICLFKNSVSALAPLLSPGLPVGSQRISRRRRVANNESALAHGTDLLPIKINACSETQNLIHSMRACRFTNGVCALLRSGRFRAENQVASVKPLLQTAGNASDVIRNDDAS